MRSFIALTLNSFIDYLLYVCESGMFTEGNQQKLISKITFNYHTLEKGFSMPNLRYGFGKVKVKIILSRIKKYINNGYNIKASQFVAACSVLTKYYEVHEKEAFDVSSYYSNEDYLLIKEYADRNIGGALETSKNDYFQFINSNYEEFSKSRHSVRNFTSELVEVTLVEKAVEIAKFCPSACNRQTSKVYYIEDSKKIENILKIQKGINATSETIRQLLVVTADRNSFFTSGERNQYYIDGGIFLQSLLLSLHYQSVAACPLHWSLNFAQDKQLKRVIGMNSGEKAVALVAIGNVEEMFKVPFSQRKSISEILVKVK